MMVITMKIKINYETEVDATNEEEAHNKFWEKLNKNNETAETFLTDLIEVENA